MEIFKQKNTKQVNDPYQDGYEHIYDELSLLDLKIQLLILTSGSNQAAPINNLHGLVLTAEEILPLINHSHIEQTHELSALVQKIKTRAESIDQRLAMSREQGVFLPLDYLAGVFSLSRFEQQCVIAGLACELDRKYEKIYAYLNDDINCKYPTVDLLINLFCFNQRDKITARYTFSEKSKLKSFFLKKTNDLTPTGTLLTEVLLLEERIVHFILNPQLQDNHIYQYARLYHPDFQPDSLITGANIQNNIRKFIAYYDEHVGNINKNIVFYLHGPAGSGKKLQVMHLCHHYGQALLCVDLRSIILFEPDSFSDIIRAICREAILQQAILYFQYFEAIIADDHIFRKRLSELINSISLSHNIIFLASETLWKPAAFFQDFYFIKVEVGLPTDRERKKIWEFYGQKYKFNEEIDWGSLANKFRFTPGQIKKSLSDADQLAGWLYPDGKSIGSEELYKACYLQVQNKLGHKTTRIDPRYHWDDLILPPEPKEQLKNACNQMKYRHIVYEDWGFEKKLSYGKGLSMLLSGPPGTGKTMSAQVVAREMHLELYKIDLSQIISKYIGETEKNLNEIFREAEMSNVILFFDESDALFGKRSEVKDAHDRYANIETSFLLQKVEEYAGVSILATNYLQNVDQAFLRRINFIIEFPFPNKEYREKIWLSIFPAGAPLNQDIDFEFIADRFEVAGGSIKNIAVSAAFLAAEQGEPIGMKHIIPSAQLELQKLGKILSRQNLGEYEYLLDGTK